MALWPKYVCKYSHFSFKYFAFVFQIGIKILDSECHQDKLVKSLMTQNPLVVSALNELVISIKVIIKIPLFCDDIGLLHKIM